MHHKEPTDTVDPTIDLDTKCGHKNSWQFRQQKISIDLAIDRLTWKDTYSHQFEFAYTIKVADVLRRYVISREYKSILQFGVHHDVTDISICR